MTILNIPTELKYIVLLHDLLNYVKLRKTTFSTKDLNSLDMPTNQTDMSFVDKFSNMSINGSKTTCDYDEDKENNSFVNNITKLSQNNKFELDDNKHNSNSFNIEMKKTKLNIERLKMIEDKENCVLFFKNIAN
jgi:hypothetical protein